MTGTEGQALIKEGLSRRAGLSVLAGIHLVAAPLYPYTPVPVMVLVFLMTLWALAMLLGKTGRPGWLIRLGLLLITIVVLVFSHGTITGRNAGTSFLMILSFMKLFEMREKRDIVIVVYIGFFLIASNFFHSQSPWVAVYVFAIVIYLTSLLIILSDRKNSTHFRDRVLDAGRMIVQATPLMLILFVLFPRIPGPLWGLPKDANVAATGLSDEMSPGTINQLIQSDDVAFRVRFDGNPPPNQFLYWRGPVLSRYDGLTWTKWTGRVWTKETGWNTKQPNLEYPETERSRVKYTVTLEPNQRNWIFALEHPVEPVVNFQYTRELQLLSAKTISNVTQYSITSDFEIKNIGLFDWERAANLKLPSNLNAETVRLASTLREQAGNDDRAVIRAALDYFTNEEFVYTLNPPLLGNDAMDEFLFETRRGFCEHYSSAFVYLMRAAGIPARIVTGYQGGVMNPVDDYMIIRQSDAHAWSEVWLDDIGWTRFDPTASVSPNRIEYGIRNAVAEVDQLPDIVLYGDKLINRARYMMDSFNNQWNEWVIGFNQERQKELFNRLGIKQVDWRDLIIWLVAAMGIVGSIIALWVFQRGPGKRSDPIRYHYDIFCRKLARAGIERSASEGPSEFFQRIVGTFPALADSAGHITDDYLAIRYGDDRSETTRQRFFRQIKSFKVKQGRQD
jgi:transglutaminase-like putative cysteine protease